MMQQTIKHRVLDKGWQKRCYSSGQKELKGDGVRVIDAEVLVVTPRNEAMLHPPVALDGEGNKLKRHARPCSTMSAFDPVTPHHPVALPFCATMPFPPLASLLGCKRIQPSRQTRKACNGETDTPGRHTSTTQTDLKIRHRHTNRDRPEGK